MKMKLALAVVVISGFLTVPAFAITPVPESPSCVEIQGDPYDPGKLMDFGPHKGQCVDTSIKRPANIIREEANYIEFANFRYNGKYRVARMPRHGVDRVIFQIEEFKTSVPFVVAAHTQMRIIMKEGSEIEVLDGGPGAPATMIRDFNWSLEYAAPKGVPYDIVHGMGDEYALVERVISTHDRGMEQMDVDRNPVRQFLLKINSQDEKDAVLVNAIEASDKARLDEIYKTLDRNCTTELFNLLDASLTYPQKVAPFKIWIFNAMDPVSGPARDALRERGLIDDQSELPTLNEETKNGTAFPYP